MVSQSTKIFITGVPGIGKTTLIRTLAKRLKDHKIQGFYTSEIRVAGVRKGFELISFNGHHGVLAHVDFQSLFRVGKYGVDLDAFERFLESLGSPREPDAIVVIDEIGKMECLSPKFRLLITEMLISDCTLIATIASKGDRFIEDCKRRPDVSLVTVTQSNRSSLTDQILALV